MRSGHPVEKTRPALMVGGYDASAAGLTGGREWLRRFSVAGEASLDFQSAASTAALTPVGFICLTKHGRELLAAITMT